MALFIVDITDVSARGGPNVSAVIREGVIMLLDIVDNASSQNLGTLEHYNPKEISLNDTLN